MKNRLALQWFSIAVILLISGCGVQHNRARETSYRVMDQTYSIMANRKFDIEYFNKNKEANRNRLEYTKEDGTKIEQSRWETYYSEYEYSPKKLYRIYRAYYLSGNLKKESIQLGGYLPIGLWKEYDEAGNEIRVQDMDAKLPKKFDYNKLMLLLHDKGHINVDTGEGRDDLNLAYDQERNRWIVSFYRKKRWLEGTRYEIDGNSGKIKVEREIIEN